MTIRTILLHAAAETCDPARSAAAYAIGLAGAFDANLEALILELDVVSPTSVYGQRIAAEARLQLDQRNALAHAAADVMRAAAQAHSVDANVVTDRSHIHSTPEIAADHARIADIVVAGVCDEGLLSERLVAEALVFESGRPVIIVPTPHRDGFRAERVVVAWDFSRVAARALAEATPLLRRAKEVSLVSFGDDKSFTSSISGQDVLAALARRGVTATFAQAKRGDRSIGDAINAAAIDQGADLLVMGGYGHSRLRDFVLGGATQRILKTPAVPTLLSH